MRTSRLKLILMFIAAALPISRSLAGQGADVPKKGSSFKVVGHLSGRNFSRIDELELNRLTHLNLAFATRTKTADSFSTGAWTSLPSLIKRTQRACRLLTVRELRKILGLPDISAKLKHHQMAFRISRDQS